LYATKMDPDSASVVLDERELDGERGPLPTQTPQGQGAAKRLDTVTQTYESGAACRICSPDPVIADGKVKRAVARRHVHADD
jgi:hypothetical protein